MDTSVYLENVSLPTDIVSEPALHAIKQLAPTLKGFSTAENIYELELTETAALTADFSFDITQERAAACTAAQALAAGGSAAWNTAAEVFALWNNPGTQSYRSIGDLWFEFDYGECESGRANPCLFIDATRVVRGQPNSWVYEEPLAAMLGGPVPAALQKHLDNCIQALPQNEGLFQLGVMLARQNGEQKVRLFTNELSLINFTDFLKQAEVPTPLPHAFLQLMRGHADGKYIADFDVSESGPSAKIGVNFGLSSYEPQGLSAFLDALCALNMAQKERCTPLLSWCGGMRDISHFKLVLDPPNPPRAKVYLREWPQDVFENMRRW